MRFANPLVLLLLPVVGVAGWFYLRQFRVQSLRYSRLKEVANFRDRSGEILLLIRRILVVLAWVVTVVALARPQGVEAQRDVRTEGVDMMLVLDASQSMMAPDLKPNRFEAAKSVIGHFISRRKHDRLGLVVFGSEAFTKCPLTLDYSILYRFLGDLQLGESGDGTAIGMGMTVALNRLKSSHAKSRVMILLTDGMNNSGEIDPMTAADLAQKMEVKIYTIGVGREGHDPIAVQIPGKGVGYIQPDLDEEMLRRIASKTGGQYFRAVDEQKLETIYDQINQLEKSEITSKTYDLVTEYFPYLIPIILVLLLIEMGLGWWLRVLP